MPNMNRLWLAVSLFIALAATLGGCINPSEKIATGLTHYGLDQAQAQCLGDRLEANLSLGQLQQLGRAARAYGEDDASPGRLTVADLVRASSRIKDVAVPIEVDKAAAGCGVLTDGGASL